MSRLNGVVRAYAELSRLSNVPTCLTNVLVGLAIGAASTTSAEIEVLKVVVLTAAVMLLYVAGMALNDAIDVNIDRRERPTRPIPSGRVSLRGAYSYVVVCMVLGLGLSALASMNAVIPAGLLIACIVSYDVAHKKAAASVILMGGCRGLVYVTAAAAVTPQLDWIITGTLAAAICVYIIVISIVARVEASGAAGARRRWAFLLPVVVLAPAAVVRPLSWIWPSIAGLLVIGWLLHSARHVARRPLRIQRAVLAWLAGICLMDAFFLSLLDQALLAAVAAASFTLTVWAHRYILGT